MSEIENRRIYCCFLQYHYASTTHVGEALCFPVVRPSVCPSFRDIFLLQYFLASFQDQGIKGQVTGIRTSHSSLPPQYLTELRDLHQTWHKYSLLGIDELIRFWRSEVKGQGHRGHLLKNEFLTFQHKVENTTKFQRMIEHKVEI